MRKVSALVLIMLAIMSILTGCMEQKAASAPVETVVKPEPTPLNSAINTEKTLFDSVERVRVKYEGRTLITLEPGDPYYKEIAEEGIKIILNISGGLIGQDGGILDAGSNELDYEDDYPDSRYIDIWFSQVLNFPQNNSEILPLPLRSFIRISIRGLDNKAHKALEKWNIVWIAEAQLLDTRFMQYRQFEYGLHPVQTDRSLVALDKMLDDLRASREK
jgi:hypothetical protein